MIPLHLTFCAVGCPVFCFSKPGFSRFTLQFSTFSTQVIQPPFHLFFLHSLIYWGIGDRKIFCLSPVCERESHPLAIEQLEILFRRGGGGLGGQFDHFEGVPSHFFFVCVAFKTQIRQQKVWTLDDKERAFKIVRVRTLLQFDFSYVGIFSVFVHVCHLTLPFCC